MAFPLSVILLLIWILFDTKYIIKNGNLIYNSGPIRGKIDVSKIIKIEFYSGFIPPVMIKPTLNYKGYIIFDSKYDGIFISPKNSDIFIDELLKINPRIDIKS